MKETNLKNHSVGEQLKWKRQKFFDAAEPLFIRFGYRKTTIEDICREVGMSKRTFYDLFRDKSDLYARLCLHISEGLIEAWEHESFIDYYVTVIIQRPIFRILLQDKETLSAFWEMGREFVDSPALDTMRAIIHQGKESGHFRELDTDNAIWMIFSLLDSMYLLIPEMLKLPPEAQETRLKDDVTAFILHGLGAGNGTR
jgi:AcrR family transcriptional regulator